MSADYGPRFYCTSRLANFMAFNEFRYKQSQVFCNMKWFTILKELPSLFCHSIVPDKILEIYYCTSDRCNDLEYCRLVQ